MAGHSKWSNIKRRKGAQDAKKGKIFTKLVRELTTAARLGGGDPAANPRLRAAIEEAKSNSMPQENIDRAIKRGTGELEGPAVEEVSYEGYGPGGVAIFVEAQTDNRNRTSADVRAAFNKNHGNMGQSGSVSWIFQQRGRFVFDADKFTEEELMEAALEAGAEDVRPEQNYYVVYSEPTAYAHVLDHFQKRELPYESAELTMVADNLMQVSGDEAAQLLRLIERLEDLDDVHRVYANFDIDDAELERLSQEQ